MKKLSVLSLAALVLLGISSAGFAKDDDVVLAPSDPLVKRLQLGQDELKTLLEVAGEVYRWHGKVFTNGFLTAHTMRLDGNVDFQGELHVADIIIEIGSVGSVSNRFQINPHTGAISSLRDLNKQDVQRALQNEIHFWVNRDYEPDYGDYP